ncbi:Primase-polymerase (primpol) domain containing protein [Halorhabdus sp. SVX81]|nr:Primase-polymerase (primpol) domain containing protein [Halorhabdus sp. SVX81]
MAAMSERSEPAMDPSAIPERLQNREQWICWREETRDGKATKVPIEPGSDEFASTTDAETWMNFETACREVEREDIEGVGFVFSEADPFVGVDLDDCRDPDGQLDETARNIVERLDSYTEVSPSGTGVHVIVEGELPDGRNRRGNVELYETARFFTVTGEHIDETPTRVAHRQDALEAVHREYVREDDSNSERVDAPGSVSPSQRESSGSEPQLDDVEVLERARSAENNRKFEDLWNGRTAGYESHSEADMALCCLLAFWTGGDRSQIDRLFRQSGLMREKWDAVHYADGSTYGEKTIERAIGTVDEFYDPTGGADANASPTDLEGQRRRTHLVEQNRLLKERIANLETRLAEKNERIEQLEGKLQRLGRGSDLSAKRSNE